MWYVRSAPAHVHVDMLALWMRICGSMDVDVDVDVDVDAMLTVGLLSHDHVTSLARSCHRGKRKKSPEHL